MPLDAPLLDQLLHLFERFFRVYATGPRVARAFVRELPGADGPNAIRMNQLTMALLQHIAGLVQRAQANGRLDPDVPPLLLAQNAFALYFMALMTWLAGMTTLEGAVPILRASLALQLRGLIVAR